MNKLFYVIIISLVTADTAFAQLIWSKSQANALKVAEKDPW